jgi:hypothetical protein
LTALVKVETALAGACSEGPAAAVSPARRVCVVVVVTVVSGRDLAVVVGVVSSIVEFFSG